MRERSAISFMMGRGLILGLLLSPLLITATSKAETPKRDYPFFVTAEKIAEELLKPVERGAGKEPRVPLNIEFDFDSDRITARAKSQMDEVAKALRLPALMRYRIRIEGHTDDRGTEEYNLGLSGRRARRVMSALARGYSFRPDRFDVRSYGESRPLMTAQTDEARARNRRVELVRLELLEIERQPKTLSPRPATIPKTVEIAKKKPAAKKARPSRKAADVETEAGGQGVTAFQACDNSLHPRRGKAVGPRSIARAARPNLHGDR